MIPEEKCPRTEQLSALADDELDAATRVAADAHVAGCAICAPVLDEIGQLRATFAALPEVRPEFELAALVDRRIAGARGSQRKPGARDWRWWRMAPVVLGGALALPLGVFLGSVFVIGALGAAQAPASRMAAFATLPPGALCPGLPACSRVGR